MAATRVQQLRTGPAADADMRPGRHGDDKQMARDDAQRWMRAMETDVADDDNDDEDGVSTPVTSKASWPLWSPGWRTKGEVDWNASMTDTQHRSNNL